MKETSNYEFSKELERGGSHSQIARIYMYFKKKSVRMRMIVNVLY